MCNLKRSEKLENPNLSLPPLVRRLLQLRALPKIACLVRDTARIPNTVASGPTSFLFPSRGSFRDPGRGKVPEFASTYPPISCHWASFQGLLPWRPPIQSPLSSQPSTKHRSGDAHPKHDAAILSSLGLVLKSSASSQIQLHQLGLKHRQTERSVPDAVVVSGAKGSPSWERVGASPEPIPQCRWRG